MESVEGFCDANKYFYRDDSFNKVCMDKPKPASCGKATGDNKKAVTAECKCGFSSDAPMCATGDFCWYSQSTCEKKAYPCEATASYCGPKTSDSEEDAAMWKEDFKGACADMSTCDKKDIEKLMALAFSSMGDKSGSGSGSVSGSGSGSGEEEKPTMPKGMCEIMVSMSSDPKKCQGPCMGGASKLAMSELVFFIILVF